jgi:hypothetical protein
MGKRATRASQNIVPRRTAEKSTRRRHHSRQRLRGRIPLPKERVRLRSPRKVKSRESCASLVLGDTYWKGTKMTNHCNHPGSDPVQAPSSSTVAPRFLIDAHSVALYAPIIAMLFSSSKRRSRETQHIHRGNVGGGPR